jgi:hypothetical protein
MYHVYMSEQCVNMVATSKAINIVFFNPSEVFQYPKNLIKISNNNYFYLDGIINLYLLFSITNSI